MITYLFTWLQSWERQCRPRQLHLTDNLHAYFNRGSWLIFASMEVEEYVGQRYRPVSPFTLYCFSYQAILEIQECRFQPITFLALILISQHLYSSGGIMLYVTFDEQSCRSNLELILTPWCMLNMCWQKTCLKRYVTSPNFFQYPHVY